MPQTTRRTFLKVSGAALGGIAVGSTVTAAERTDRFIVETTGRGIPGNLDVVHDMQGVDFAVVQGSESAIRSSSLVKDYAPDVEVELDDPDVNDESPILNETSITDQPHYQWQWDKQVLDVETAHETTKGDGTTVTIIDTGITAAHPDLDVDQGLSQNFTGDGFGAGVPAGGYHGTHVAGIVAARTEEEEGIGGTAPETTLVDCRVFSPGTLASFADILAAIEYSAAIDADAANLSLGAYPIPRQEIGQFYGKALNRVMTYANKEGTLLAIAAGNTGADLQHDKNFISLPNEGAQAVSISATGPIGFMWDADGDGEDMDYEDPPESPAYYTNYGTNAIDLAAPGGDADLAAIGTGVPWYFDLVLSTIFSGSGSLISGVFGPESDNYSDELMAAEYYGVEDHPVLVAAYGQPPSEDNPTNWYDAVGLAGVRFEVPETTFTGNETVQVDYDLPTHDNEVDHDRDAPDWIAFYVDDDGDDDVDHIVIDWQVQASSGAQLSWNDGSDFGNGPGGVFEATSVPQIFDDPSINPNSGADVSSLSNSAKILGVGVFSGDGLVGNESVDIFYHGVSFEDEQLLEPDYTYNWAAGTSMAAPQVAGAAALVKSANPHYNANQVQSALERAADVPKGYDKTFYGSGFLNIVDAL